MIAGLIVFLECNFLVGLAWTFEGRVYDGRHMTAIIFFACAI
jgi:hypothetical protein